MNIKIKELNEKSDELKTTNSNNITKKTHLQKSKSKKYTLKKQYKE